MKINLPTIEPELKGTIIGKVRLLMRMLDMADKSPAEFLSKLAQAGLAIDHSPMSDRK